MTSGSATPIRWWQSLTTADADRVAAADPVVILPLAAIEQHGPHLPLSTDLDIGLGLLAEAFRLKSGRKVEISRPQRGEKRDLVQHALTNAREALGRKMAESSAQSKLLAPAAKP